MKQKFAGSILVTALLICLFMTGNAFATNYAYVLVPGSDVIKIYNFEGNSLVAILDLDGGSSIYAVDIDPDTPGDQPGIRIEPLVIDENYTPNGTTTFGAISAMAVGPQERYLYFVTDNGATKNGVLYQFEITGDASDGDSLFSSLTKLGDVGKRPKDIVIDYLGNYVFIANYVDDSVTKYSKLSGIALTIYGFYKPVALAVTSGYVKSGSSDLYVANFEPQSGKYYVSMYNTFMKVDIEVTNRPTDIVTTIDNEYVYVCNSSDTAGLISVIKPIDYLDVESDGDAIFDIGENTVVDNISIPDAKPTRMALVDLENKIYAIDPVFVESGGDLTITPGTGIMSVIDCSGRKSETIDPDDVNEANIFSQSVAPAVFEAGTETTTDYSGGVSIAGTRNGTSVFTVTGVNVEHSFFETDIESATLRTELFSTDAGVTETFSQIVLSGTMPAVVSGLSAEAENGKILLKWLDSADDELGYFIFRRDLDNDDNEYKFHLFDTVEGNTGLEADDENIYYLVYTDDTVLKGYSYEYIVVPYNEITRANTGTPVNIKARDDSSSDICFISSVSSNSGSALIVLMLIAGFFMIVVVRKQNA